MEIEMAKKDLVKLIRENPGAVFTVDSDCWWMHCAPPKTVDEMTDDELDDWRDNGQLADDRDIAAIGDGGYGSGCRRGGDILQALAVIVGVKIESV